MRQVYRVASEPPLYNNRIHTDDAAAGLLAFLLRPMPPARQLTDCYLGVDDARQRHCTGWWGGCVSSWA